MKRCGRCRRTLPTSAFAAKRSAPDGLQHWCRECNSAWAAEHRPRKMTTPPAVGPGEKWCRRCETVKPSAAFAVNVRRPDGLQTYCRECQAADYRSKQELAGKVVRPADVPVGYKFCRTCRTVKPRTEFGIRTAAPDGLMSACRPCRSELGRRDHLKRSYDLTEDQVEAMREAQGGLCAICRAAPAVHVDHDHTSGRVRGMLCFSCNAALGHFRDDPVVLRRAARYLEGRRPRRTAHKHGLRYEILLPEDELAPRPGEGVFEGWLRAMLAIRGSRVEHIRFGSEAAASDATEGTP